MQRTSPGADAGIIIAVATLVGLWLLGRLLGIEAWLVQEQCGVRSASMTIDALLEHLHCEDRVGFRYNAALIVVVTMLSHLLSHLWMRREAAREKTRNDNLDREIERIRSKPD